MSDQLLLLGVQPPRLMAISLDGQVIESLVPDCTGTPDGICIDYKRRKIYWTNMGLEWSKNDGFIESIDFDGANRTVVVQPGQTFTPKQMQIDQEKGLLYWCDREGMRVMRSRLDGSEITVLIQTGEGDEDRADERRHCVGIALDHENDLLYWTQKGPPNGGKGKILRAGLELPPDEPPNARTDIEVVFDNLPEPIDLEWVAEDGVLYWTDRGDPPLGNTLNRCRFDGVVPGKPEILMSNLQEGIGLALDSERSRAFVSDLGGNVHVPESEGTGSAVGIQARYADRYRLLEVYSRVTRSRRRGEAPRFTGLRV